MTRPTDFYISSGDLKDDCKSEDISYWQKLSPLERFNAGFEMAQEYEIRLAKKENRKAVTFLDKTHIVFGSYKK